MEARLREIAQADERADCDPARGAGHFNRRWEISSTGIDPSLQTIGGDPNGTLSSTGLLIPPASFSANVGRYLFQLVSVKIGDGRRVRVRGLGQLLTLGLTQAAADTSHAPFVVEQPVVTPNFKFQDGNVSWHLVRVLPKPLAVRKKTDSDNFIFRWANTDSAGALLYENFSGPVAHTDPVTGRLDFYTFLDHYAPPMFPAYKPLDDQLCTFRDLRFPWDESEVWHSLDIPVEGPCNIVLFASVRQTNPSTRAKITLPDAPTGFASAGIMPEQQFLQYFPTAEYFRIGGRLIFEDMR